MKVRKSVLVAGAVSAVGLAGLLGGGIVTAHSAASAGNDSLIEKIASKFNLNKDEVQKVFDEEKSARDAERQAAFTERLQKLVDDGKITSDQKSKIEEKHKELKANMEAERNELEKWATDNNIDEKYLMFGGPRGGEDRLQKLVDDGAITADQKNSLDAKLAELKEKREAARDALQAWAEDNNIDEKYLMFGGGHGGRGPGGPGRN